MNRTRSLALAALVALTAACSAAPGEKVGGSAQAVTTAHESYYGGPVVQDVKVVLVTWGTVNGAGQLPAFYSAVTNSAYMDWLSEYGTTGHPIGRGTYAGNVSVPAPTTSTFDDSALQSALDAMITAGTLPKPDANTVYANHFAPGVTITMGGSASCQQFCSYHGTFLPRSGGEAFYTVVPDMGGGCALGCGNGDPLGNTTLQASKQLVNAITDPAVGLATSTAAPLAWYDPQNGEVGDPCNGQSAILGSGWTVQLGWSNYSGACIAAPSAPAAPPPTPPSCTTRTACDSVVDVSCAAYTQGIAILRQDPGSTEQVVGSLPQAGGTFGDSPPGATAVYQACAADGTTCGPALNVTVNTNACITRPPPPPPKCGLHHLCI
jgi:hypothetical protein